MTSAQGAALEPREFDGMIPRAGELLAALADPHHPDADVGRLFDAWRDALIASVAARRAARATTNEPERAARAGGLTMALQAQRALLDARPRTAAGIYLRLKAGALLAGNDTMDATNGPSSPRFVEAALADLERLAGGSAAQAGEVKADDRYAAGDAALLANYRDWAQAWHDHHARRAAVVGEEAPDREIEDLADEVQRSFESFLATPSFSAAGHALKLRAVLDQEHDTAPSASPSLHLMWTDRPDLGRLVTLYHDALNLAGPPASARWLFGEGRLSRGGGVTGSGDVDMVDSGEMATARPTPWPVETMYRRWLGSLHREIAQAEDVMSEAESGEEMDEGSSALAAYAGEPSRSLHEVALKLQTAIAVEQDNVLADAFAGPSISARMLIGAYLDLQRLATRERLGLKIDEIGH